MRGSGFRFYGSVFFVQGSGFRISDLKLRVEGWLKIQGPGFRVWDSGFGGQGLG